MIKPLSDEDIEAAYKKGEDRSHYLTSNIEGKRAVARKAEQEILEQVIEWGDEPCVSTKHTPPLLKKKRNCTECWQELKKQAEEGR